MDFGALFDKFQGESERKLREALRVADAMQPCVLWMDEIEKALASGGDGDGGTSQRVLGTFLTWLQERRGHVFVVATANDISRLPPELLRKGRFDEIFFVDLPSREVRRAILATHLSQKGRCADDFDLDALAGASTGFSGSELAQAITSALYEAFDSGSELATDIILAELQATRPLSVVMSEKVQALRDWATSRTIPAD
jgi:SpoVK/Ycf46/Vps4 family AAA+-type ATPase